VPDEPERETHYHQGEIDMNSFLAEMYGTRETIGATSSADQDVEKLAEAQLLDQALQAEGVDVDQLDAGTLLKVAYSLFGEDSALVKAAMDEEGEPEEGETPAEEKKETPAEEKKEETEEEKVAQADFLGRVMAHAFVQEQDAITKEALSLSGAKEGLFAAGRAIKGAPGKAVGAVKSGLKGKAEAMKGSYLWGGRHSPTAIGRGVKGALEVAKAHPKTVGGAAAGLGLTGGAAAMAAKKGKKKKASALDSLAEERALEILKEAGVQVGQEPSEEEKLAAAVEQRAWEMLAEAGYLNE
jgi:hypothetical protein